MNFIAALVFIFLLLFGDIAAKAETMTSFDGQTISYQKIGDGENTLIFVHGWMCDSSFWDAQIDAFKNDFTLLIPDLPGHGHSDKTRAHWSLEAFGRDIALLADAEGKGSLILVGHSMGGPVVVEAAKNIGRRVKLVVGVDTMKRPGTVLDPATIKAHATEIRQNYSQMVEQIVRGGYFHQSASPTLIDRVTNAMAEGDPAIAADLVTALYSFDQAGAIRAIRATPLSFINSDARPINKKAIIDLHPDTRLLEVAHSGHFLMMEQSDTFNSLLAAEIERALVP